MSVRRDIDFPIHIPYTPLTLEERKQNKILLILSQSNSNQSHIENQNYHYCCSLCNTYFRSEHYLYFCLYLLNSNCYRQDIFNNHINAILTNDLEKQKRHNCVFCTSIIQQPFSRFLSLNSKSYIYIHDRATRINLKQYFQKTEEELIIKDRNSKIEPLTTTSSGIDLSFHRCLYLLSKALPLDVYDLRVNHKPYQSYSRYDWYMFYKSNPTELLIQIFNESHNQFYRYRMYSNHLIK